MKEKPVRYGNKIYKLCSSIGYCLNFEVYYGKQANDNNPSKLTHDLSVALKLVSCIRNPEHHFIYLDNYFTSYDLLCLSQRPRIEIHRNGEGKSDSTVKRNIERSFQTTSSNLRQRQRWKCNSFQVERLRTCFKLRSHQATPQLSKASEWISNEGTCSTTTHDKEVQRTREALTSQTALYLSIEFDFTRKNGIGGLSITFSAYPSSIRGSSIENFMAKHHLICLFSIFGNPSRVP